MCVVKVLDSSKKKKKEMKNESHSNEVIKHLS